MTEDSFPRGSSSESASSTDPSISKQRKKRKWDQPEESLVSAGVCQPPILPFTNIGSFVGMALPSIGATCGTLLATPLTANGASVVQQHTTKIQDEVIAREIVINDADSAVRYKLTKRQTQEEIQKSTGAVVITRGKYMIPSAQPDGAKPLYLHISAGAHLETTVERIKAVDHAASLVEEILKEGSSNNGLKQANPSMSTCVYVGFEVDASLNISARIRGPNDQYINHIMNETGATVVLRGQGSEGSGTVHGEDGHQPLHLFLSSNNSKSLERAKLLAENLLDTISAEFGASRVSSCKVYGAVPPPPQLLAGSNSLGDELKVNNSQDANLSSASVGVSVPAVPSVAPGMDMNVSQGIVPQSLGSFIMLPSQSNTNYYPHTPILSGTSYMGYGGIYPQVTPLQQVALALRQSISKTAAGSPESTTSTRPLTTTTSFIQKERPPHKRKFRELPTNIMVASNLNQGFMNWELHGIAACYLNNLGSAGSKGSGSNWC
ncbi:unnamed protein product [Cuscuta epithymum]|uniref:Protein RIK n=1 Tax=Cuscuta epithymum TaxID=186058 RepID=A0AAV0G7D3_9ASTE|nr:unnamed protein product [Cuscuta epithymum]CAH9143643.1 unnamed protein product [Cuscuta epithymum]